MPRRQGRAGEPAATAEEAAVVAAADRKDRRVIQIRLYLTLMAFWGPHHEEVWRELAALIGGEFTDGGWFGQDKVELRWKSWLITLDKYVVSTGKSSTVYTRIRAPYVNRDGFRFKVYREGYFTGLGKAMGLTQDIEIGDPGFDREFVVQGNDPAKVRAMLGQVGLRRLIEAQPKISFEVKDDEGWFGGPFPEGVDELYFVAHGIIKDLGQLRDLFRLFAEVLDYLSVTRAE